VRLAIYCTVALALCCLQHSVLARWPIAPDLPLALAAWAMVDGDDEGVFLRAWLTGIARDLFDPASGATYAIDQHCFYTLAYTGLGLAAIGVRTLIFRTRGIGWAAWALIASLALALIDSRIAGVPISWLLMTTEAILTAIAAIGAGWILGNLPEAVRPIGKGGA
jgi:hypothetical protein